MSVVYERSFVSLGITTKKQDDRKKFLTTEERGGEKL